MTEQKIKETMNYAIDELCDSMGIRWTISFLIEGCDWTRDELTDAGFEEDDVDYVISELGEDN